ncbi:MAG: PAS domain S-box protein [Desulfobulbaceae bacterium]|jgi:PAS domain S-box-containing protein|nr:PAS domain S-box protein [Desulfobulbaceae bacterium]
MPEKPTYEDLERKVRALQTECSELQRKIELLGDRESKYRFFFENSLDALFINRPDGRVIEANPAACELFGYTEEELIRKGRNAIVDPGDQRLIRALQQREREGTFAGELAFHRKDGTEIPVEITSVIFETGEGKQSSLIVRDIRKRKLDEQQRMEQEQLNQLLLDSFPCVALLLRPRTRIIIAMNRAAREAGCALGHTCYETWAKFKEPCPWCLAPGLWEEGRPQHREVEALGIAWDAHWIPVGDDLFLHYAFDITEQKLAEKELEKQQNLLHLMERISRIGAWEYEVPTGKVSWTDGVYPIYGLDRHEYDPADIDRCIEYYHPEDRRIISEAFRRAVEKGEPYDLELRFRSRDGTDKWVRTLGQAEMDKGRVVRVYGNIMDITESKLAEKALRDSEAFIRAVMDHLPIGLAVVSIDPAVDFVYMNDNFPRFYRTTGKALAELDAFWEAVYEDPVFRGEIKKRVLEDHASGDPERMYWEDVPITRRGEETSFICARNTPVPEKSLMISTVWDVTDRKRTENALRKSEERFRFLAEYMADIVWTSDLEFRTTYASPSVEKILGFSPGERKSQTLEEKVTPASRRKIEELLAVELQGEMPDPDRSMTIEIEYYHKNGGTVWLEDTLKWIRDEHGAIVGILGVSRDISERRHAEEEREKLQQQLVQAQKLESVGRLAGGVAHDYNNMLSVIVGYTEMAMDRVDPSGLLYADLAEVQKAARRSIDITRQLLAFARKQTIDPRVIDLNEVVESMLKMLRRLIGEDIDLAWHPGKQLWAVKMDPAQVDQIMANLCVNARDAISGVGKVTIETGNAFFDKAYGKLKSGHSMDEFVHLTVSDNGCGMDRETLENIFEPFFTTKGVSEGTGLGLATVYGIVRQNNGFINVSSEPGKGTTFQIYLPRHAGEQLPEAVESKARIPMSRGETVLMVEDEAAILKMGEMMLSNLGYRVLTAGSPGQALEIAGKHGGDIDLLITDVIMPEMNGRLLADQLSSVYPGLKTLFMSGYTADVIARRGVLEEGRNFIQKPFTLQELGDKVNAVLRGR